MTEPHGSIPWLPQRVASVAAAVAECQTRLDPDLWSPRGAVTGHESVPDTRDHVSYLLESLAAEDPILFVDYVQWLGTLFEGLGLPLRHVVTILSCLREALEKEMPASRLADLVEYLDAGRCHIEARLEANGSLLDREIGLGPLATEYTELLLQGSRQRASDLIMKALDRGTPVRELYLEVFQPAQREIGRLWQTNRISVGQEHFCTAATQLIMSQLYPHIFSTSPKGRRVVASSVSGELHEIGVRMVADFLEMDGWDSHYLGANTPPESVAQAVQDHGADLLAISATLTPHVAAVRSLIEEARSRPAIRRVKIMVGGYPFNVAPTLWARLGADGSAKDAAEAVSKANQLVG